MGRADRKAILAIVLGLPALLSACAGVPRDPSMPINDPNEQSNRKVLQLNQVVIDPAANVAVAREEIIRYCAPAQWFARTVRRPFTIHGATIQPGQRIISLLASANRDDREYSDPEAFIWDRPIERSLAFGRGQHFCLGYHLARLEIAVLLQEWLRRVPGYRIEEAAARRPPSSFQWGWNNVPVEV